MDPHRTTIEKIRDYISSPSIYFDLASVSSGIGLGVTGVLKATGISDWVVGEYVGYLGFIGAPAALRFGYEAIRPYIQASENSTTTRETVTGISKFVNAGFYGLGGSALSAVETGLPAILIVSNF